MSRVSTAVASVAALCASVLTGCGPEAAGEEALSATGSVSQSITCSAGQEKIEVRAAGLKGPDGVAPLMGIAISGVVKAQFSVPSGVPAGTPLDKNASTAGVTYTTYGYCHPTTVSTSAVSVRLLNGGNGKALAVDKIYLHNGVPYETEATSTKSQGTYMSYGGGYGCTSLGVWQTQWLHCPGGEFRYGQW